jgi:salicylate hydroxylase
LVGDAAHTHGGSFAAGGSLALDDSLALALAFKHVILPRISSPGPISASAIKQAIQLYDSVRRPHTTRLLEIVHGQLGAKKPVYSSDEDAEKSLQTKVKGRPNTNWLSEHDVEETFFRVVGQSKQTPSERARL